MPNQHTEPIKHECYSCGCTATQKWYLNFDLETKEYLNSLCNTCTKRIIYGTYYRSISAKRKRDKRGLRSGKCSFCTNSISNGTCKQTAIINGRETCASCHAKMTNKYRLPLPRNKFGMFFNGEDKQTEEEYRRYFRERRAKQVLPVKDTSIELKIQKGLAAIGVECVKHKVFMVAGKSHQVDIFIPPNTCVECDGTYFHSLQKSIERDLEIDLELERLGMKVVRLKEYDINTNLPWCIAKVLQFIRK